MSNKWSPSNFGLGTIFRRTSLNFYPKKNLGINQKDTCVNSVNGSQAPVVVNEAGFNGVITSPTFGTANKRKPGQRFVLQANVPVQVYFNSPQTVRVSIRNVGNNAVIFDRSSNVSLTQYGNALQGATGAEPTAGESDVFDSRDDIWALSPAGTVLIVDEEQN